MLHFLLVPAMRCNVHRGFRSSALRLSASVLDMEPRTITVVGGGMAGLSTTYHLLQKASPGSHVTIIDKAPVGTAGASSVAGGYVPYCCVKFLTHCR